ncbi:Peptidase S8/S53 domain containing protein [Rhypophila sp. PSN 637]
MAKQIQQMCPKAQLYVLRLEDHPSDDGGRQISAKSAAQAIRAAVKKQVHIISMSWTVGPPENDTVRRDLEKAITDAANENTLMFCSASDKGANQNETYPSKATNNIFKIGAANPAGRPDQWVRNVDFIFPGSNTVEHDAKSSFFVSTTSSDGQVLPGVTTKETLVVSGSSIATALAAGLAALLLHCVQVRIFLGVSEEEKKILRAKFEGLKTHDQMKQAFKKIGVTEDNLVTVWEVFGNDEKLGSMLTGDGRQLQVVINKATKRFIGD